jgi:hypothetical protein
MAAAKKFTKKPVTIEAIQFTGFEDVAAILEFVGDEASVQRGLPDKEGDLGELNIIITTLEGEMKAGKGWWIIKGIKGEFYPCRDDIFVESYDPAT